LYRVLTRAGGGASAAAGARCAALGGQAPPGASGLITFFGLPVAKASTLLTLVA
jgi:hypothetical protein